MRRLHRHLGRDSRRRFQSTSVPEEHIGWGNRQDPLPGRPRVLLKRKPHAVRIPRPRARLLATLRHSRLPTRRVFPSRGLSLSASADGTCSFNGPYRAPAGRSARERDHVRSERRPAYAAHCAGFAGGAEVVPPCRACCLVERFIWRHSGRVFSSPALQACFAVRAPCRTLRRSSRRSMPCVWADAGTALSNITPAANAAAALPREIRMLILLFAAASAASFGHGKRHSKKQTPRLIARSHTEPPAGGAPLSQDCEAAKPPWAVCASRRSLRKAARGGTCKTLSSGRRELPRHHCRTRAISGPAH